MEALTARLAELVTDPVSGILIIWALIIAAGFLAYWGIAREYRRREHRQRTVRAVAPAPLPRRSPPPSWRLNATTRDITVRLERLAIDEATRELAYLTTYPRTENHR